MRIASAILIICFVATSCSGIRKSGRTVNREPSGNDGTVYYTDVYGNNVISKGLFARKVDVEVKSEAFSGKFTANLKVSAEGEWLISIRSFAGIEISRIFAEATGVTILDRVARTAQIFTWERLKKLYGLEYEMLPLILGDLPALFSGQELVLPCDRGVNLNLDDQEILITTDCSRRKAGSILIRDMIRNVELNIMFAGFNNTKGGTYPAEVKITGGPEGFSLKAEIVDAEIPWNGEILFDIPVNYKIMR